MALNSQPGVGFIYKDGGLVVTPPAPTGDSILIIGCALDGPVNTPVQFSNLDAAITYFGPLVYSGDYVNPLTGSVDGANAGNSLLTAMIEANLGGGSNITLVRIGGPGSAVATGGTNIGGKITVTAKYPGNVYNTCTLTVTLGVMATTFTLLQPPTKGGTITYTFANTAILGSILNQINADPSNNCFVLTAGYTDRPLPLSGLTLTQGTPVVSTLGGGTNGTRVPGEYYGNLANSAGLRTALVDANNGTFTALADFPTDLIYLACVCGDDLVTAPGDSNATTTSIATDFATFLYNCSANNYPTHGVLGLRPTQKSNNLDLLAYANSFYLSTNSGWADQSAGQISFGYFMANGFSYTDVDRAITVDTGRFLSVFAGPDIVVNQQYLGIYAANGGGAYVGLISSLAPKDTTTRRPLGSIAATAGNFPRATVNSLIAGVGQNLTSRTKGGGAYVVLRNYLDIGSPAIVDDVTASQRGSDFQKLQPLRVANLASHLVRAATVPFIGKGMDIPTRTALRNQISSSLDHLGQSGALLGGEGQGYTFTMSTGVGQSAAVITIDLQLNISLALRNVNVTVSVTA